MPKASVDCCSQPGLMRPDLALEKILAHVSAVTDTEQVGLDDAMGRILAQPVVSLIDLPPFDNSAMDGYACRWQDLQSGQPLTLVGTSLAGHPFEGDTPKGSCVRIMTGGQIPKQYDTVQMQENAQANGNSVVLQQPYAQGAHVRPKGEEASQGQVIYQPGVRIGAPEMGVLATVGAAKVTVYRRLTVAFFSTGDELKPVGSELNPGDIYDSNRYAIKGLLSRSYVDYIDLGVISDDPDKIRSAFLEAAEVADVVITSGGVSVGDADFVKQILDEVGQINFWKLAIKPGKPFAFGQIGKALFCGLPGNPVSSMVTYYKLVQPILAKRAGLPTPPVLKVPATLTCAIRKRPGRMEYQRGIYSYDAQGKLQVMTTGAQGSGMLTSMSVSNCFIVLDMDQGNVAAGETVTIEPYQQVLE
ncbi:molybdopterin molybdotransferase MoeA [Paraferrimonas haliotis]|uniref:Molybdopterin molybdenumtransferase n=1 Tax=Paraferrimonas haliotis TaxID=2013866 RepID=A0AA37WY89_9GAMM|nr:molybdopterin molybdotransferase MoeA [Paraferrimonas haliotis]GLS84992.1 molybdopterin molybdenumtransferase MoeA [Paraferrimonas haliotis]